MIKALIPTEMSKGQNDNTKTSPKSSIIQRLRTDKSIYQKMSEKLKAGEHTLSKGNNFYKRRSKAT